jgi:flagellar motor component MotA
MKLAKYLTDYIKRECEISMTGDVAHKMEEVMQQGIKTFASTERKRVVVTDERCRQHEFFGEIR